MPDRLEQVFCILNDMRLSSSKNREHPFTHESIKKLPVENEHFYSELDIIRQLQPILLPKELEYQEITDVDITGFMLPADTISGDYYDVFEHNGRIIMGIGDVMGHGLESGLLALMAQIIIRTLIINNVSELKMILTRLNEMFYKKLKQLNLKRNLTLALLEYHEGRLTISGQHEEVIIIRLNDYLERIDTIDLGFMIGLNKDISPFLNETQVILQPGEGMVLYTDGIIEAKNTDKVEYGLDRLCKVIGNHKYCSAADIRQAIRNDVQHYIGNQKIFDDLTLLVLKRKLVEKELEI